MSINHLRLIVFAFLLAISPFASVPARSELFAEDGNKIYTINLETGASTFYANLPEGWDAWGPDMYGNSDSIVYADYSTNVVKFFDSDLGEWVERSNFELLTAYNALSPSAKDLKSFELNGGLISANASSISSNDTDISSNASSITTNASGISSNDTDISSLQSLVKSSGSEVQIGSESDGVTISSSAVKVGGENMIRKESDGSVHIGKNSLVLKESGGRQQMWATDVNGDSIDIDVVNGSRLLINGRDVEKSIDNVGALSAALGSVPTVSADSQFTCGFGGGTYSSAYAFSGGCASRVSDRVSVNAALATVVNNHTGDADDNLSARAGVTFRLGKIDDSPKVAARKAAELRDEVAKLREENLSMRAESLMQKQINSSLAARLEQLERIASSHLSLLGDRASSD